MLKREDILKQLGNMSDMNGYLDKVFVNKEWLASDDVLKMLKASLQGHDTKYKEMIDADIGATINNDKITESFNTSYLDFSKNKERNRIGITNIIDKRQESYNEIVYNMTRDSKNFDKQVHIHVDGNHYVSMALLSNKGKTPIFIYDDSLGNPMPQSLQKALTENKIDQRMKIVESREKEQSNDGYSCSIRSSCNALFYALNTNREIMNRVNTKEIFQNKLPNNPEDIYQIYNKNDGKERELSFGESFSSDTLIPSIKSSLRPNSYKNSTDFTFDIQKKDELTLKNQDLSILERMSKDTKHSDKSDDFPKTFQISPIPTIQTTEQKSKGVKEAEIIIPEDESKIEDEKYKKLFEKKRFPSSLKNKFQEFFSGNKKTREDFEDSFLGTNQSKTIFNKKMNKTSKKPENEMMNSFMNGPSLKMKSYENNSFLEKNINICNLTPKEGTIFLVGNAAEKFKESIGHMSPEDLYEYAKILSKDPQFKEQSLHYQGKEDQLKLQDFLLKEKSRQFADELGKTATREYTKNLKEKDQGIQNYRQEKIQCNLEYREHFKKISTSKDTGILEKFNNLNQEYLNVRNQMRNENLSKFVMAKKDPKKLMEKARKIEDINKALQEKGNRSMEN